MCLLQSNNFFLLLLWYFFARNYVVGQSASPCPAVFQYEPGGASDGDRWYGAITLHSTVDLTNGIALSIVLDKKADLLGNWIGETSSTDNKEFLIRNPSYRLNAGQTKTERIFVKYTETAPSLKEIRFNYKVICSSTVGNFIPKEDCGRVTQQRPLVTHGSQASIAHFPWHAALYKYENNNPMYNCGGSLISKKHVITAAHCVTKTLTTEKPLNPSELIVYLGKQSLKNFNSPNIQDVEVQEIIIYPGYSTNGFRNDIAILKLSLPVVITNFVRTICLWQGETETAGQLYDIGRVVGWGFNEHGKLSDQLQLATMPIVAKDTCIYSNRQFYAFHTSETNYCAGFRNGTSVCNGDSGGGMTFIIKGTERNPVWQLRGLVSLAAPLVNTNVCNTEQYIIFTDVAKFIPWIKQVLEQ